MNKSKNIVVVLLAITVSMIIITLTLLFVFLDKKEFSDTENRYLEKLPQFSFESLKSGEYIRKLETYLTDHFPFRNEFMFLKTSALKGIGQNKISGLYLGEDGYLLEEYTVTPESTNIPIDVLNRFNDNLPDNTNMSLMLVPTSVEIYSEKLPKYSTNTSQKDVIEYVYNNINFDGINVYDYLEKESTTIDLYYKTDHHWTTFGAYLGYVAYMNYLGIEDLERPTFEKITDEFYGTFYSKLIDNSLERESMYKLKDDETEYIMKDVATNTVMDTIYEEKWLNEKDKYSYFLGQNKALLEIQNNSMDNNKKILIVKDSYGNSMIPFIAQEYEHVYVIDPRLYRLDVSDYVKENEIEEVLLVYNVKTIETDLGIRNLR